MCSSYKAINIIKQSDISNHELSIFLNNISKEALVDYLIYSRLPINPNKISKNKMIEIIIIKILIIEIFENYIIHRVKFC